MIMELLQRVLCIPQVKHSYFAHFVPKDHFVIINHHLVATVGLIQPRLISSNHFPLGLHVVNIDLIEGRKDVVMALPNHLNGSMVYFGSQIEFVGRRSFASPHFFLLIDIVEAEIQIRSPDSELF